MVWVSCKHWLCPVGVFFVVRGILYCFHIFPYVMNAAWLIADWLTRLIVYSSPILKTPTTKPRRPSAVVSRSTSGTAASNTTVDDFEELMSEFTDDHLEEDVDPSIGEDDLLQELSEMIDSWGSMRAQSTPHHLKTYFLTFHNHWAF